MHNPDIRTEYQKKVAAFVKGLSDDQRNVFLDLWKHDDEIGLATAWHVQRQECIASGEHMIEMEEQELPKGHKTGRFFCKRCKYAK